MRALRESLDVAVDDACSVAAAAFEVRFPHHPARIRPGYACLSVRWAGRLERAAARIDWLAGEPGAGIRRLLDLIERHELDWGAALKRIDGPTRRPRVVWRDGEPVQGGELPSGRPRDPMPVSLAYFAQKLHRESKIAAIRRRGSKTYLERARPDQDPYLELLRGRT